MANEGIIAVGLLTQRDVETLGIGFRRLWPIDEAPCFSELLQAIDEVDRGHSVAFGGRGGPP